MPPITKKALEIELAAIRARLAEAEQAKQTIDAELAQAQAVIVEKTAALELATAQAAALPAANGQENIAGGGDHNVVIPRPSVPRGKRIAIREAMGVEEDDYRCIQNDLHKIVYASGIDWKKDFRHQDQEALTLMYRTARRQHPILRNYENNWATTELVKMYLQNARATARSKGYLEPAPPRRNG